MIRLSHCCWSLLHDLEVWNVTSLTFCKFLLIFNSEAKNETLPFLNSFLDPKLGFVIVGRWCHYLWRPQRGGVSWSFGQFCRLLWMVFGEGGVGCLGGRGNFFTLWRSTCTEIKSLSPNICKCFPKLLHFFHTETI